MLRKMLFLVVVIVAAAAAWVRLAPVVPADWHSLPARDTAGVIELPGEYGEIRQITTTPQTVLSALDQLAIATPRTVRLAGSLAEGMITYETRSLIWGLPDYTTIAVKDTQDGALLIVTGRLRFGLFDLGANKVRVTRWLDTLGPLTVRP